MVMRITPGRQARCDRRARGAGREVTSSGMWLFASEIQCDSSVTDGVGRVARIVSSRDFSHLERMKRPPSIESRDRKPIRSAAMMEYVAEFGD